MYKFDFFLSMQVNLLLEKSIYGGQSYAGGLLTLKYIKSLMLLLISFTQIIGLR